MAAFPGKLGTGQRFAACVARMTKKGARNPKALCASIGRKKFGKRRFQKLAAAGKK